MLSQMAGFSLSRPNDICGIRPHFVYSVLDGQLDSGSHLLNTESSTPLNVGVQTSV